MQEEKDMPQGKATEEFTDEEVSLNEIFGHPNNRKLDKKLEGPSGVEYEISFCGLCDCYSIRCPEEKCHGASCNGSGCDSCSDDFDEFNKLETSDWD